MFGAAESLGDKFMDVLNFPQDGGCLVYSDEDVFLYFERVAECLSYQSGMTVSEAEVLARDFYFRFTDESYCTSIGIGVMDDEFFFREEELSMSFLIYYYMLVADQCGRADKYSWDAFADWERSIHARADAVAAEEARQQE